MSLQVEVEGEGMSNDLVDHHSSRQVAGSIGVFGVLGEESHMVPLGATDSRRNDDESA